MFTIRRGLLRWIASWWRRMLRTLRRFRFEASATSHHMLFIRRNALRNLRGIDPEEFGEAARAKLRHADGIHLTEVAYASFRIPSLLVATVCASAREARGHRSDQRSEADSGEPESGASSASDSAARAGRRTKVAGHRRRTRRPRRPRSRKAKSLARQNSRHSHHDVATVGGHVADAGRGKIHDQDRETAECDDIRRSNAQAHIGHPRGRQRPDENGDGARRQNRPADVRNRRYARCDHWAYVHVCHPRLRLPIVRPFVLFTTSTPLLTNPLKRVFNCSGSDVAASITAAVTSFAVMK